MFRANFTLLLLLVFSICKGEYLSNRTLYSIVLDSKLPTLQRCIGPTGHIQTTTHHTIFLIYNRPNYCEDIVKNAARNYIYNYYPTHTDVYKNETNQISMKCDSKFVLYEESPTTTLLQSYCFKKDYYYDKLLDQ
ncbi:unnamed protein product [Bursaphelenchus okinawaensis]|uniref:Uncharacterized protein n=1 Tax=Bursaphelenchus okinawaensis TaxID=465554 RepID=A0A811KCY1_9BILA|nr:unnamed protein product [Bursaphelenchus okinawaensis]CAG9099041.1 unnamed protein product [Bursaphelenchus okinawaensis]